MRPFIYFVLVLAMGLTACKKGKADLVLRGTISDATFNSPLSGATVQLYELEAGGGSTNLLGTSTVGSDGSYSFTFPRNAAESYIVEIRKDGYFDKDFSIPLSDLSVEEDNVHDYSTTAKSWAGLRFTSTGSSSVTYIRQSGKSGCDICCTSEPKTVSGPIDTVIYCPNDGNTTYSYTYNANGATGLKSTNTVAFDTTIITLSF